MRLLLVACFSWVFTATASAQIVRVSGRIVEEGTGTPIGGVVVRVTGSIVTMTTGASGTFSFGELLGGPIVLTVSSLAYEFQSIPLQVASDTVVTIVLKRKITTLDPMVVRPRLLRVRGQVLDDGTGDAILFAQVSLFPEGRTIEASNTGRFTLDKVPAGEVTLVVEAMEYLPAVVRFNSARDTTLTVRMAIDSVAMRVMGAQVIRLHDRAQGSQFAMRAFNREAIVRERRSTVGELVDRLMLVPFNPATRQGRSPEDACVFYDDRKIAPGMLDGMYPEVIERVEVYNQGGMIRVYSKRYVMSLMARGQLKTVTYLQTGLGTVCG